MSNILDLVIVTFIIGYFMLKLHRLSLIKSKKDLTEEESNEKTLERLEKKLKVAERYFDSAEAMIETEIKVNGTTEQIKKWKEIKEIDIGLSDNFFNMNPYNFEKFIGDLLVKMGYRNVRITKKSGDFGIDVVADKGNSRYAIQVKRQKNPVGNEIIQNTLGSMSKYGATRAMVITNSRFTKQAIEQAKSDKRIELWDKEKLHLAVRKYFL